MVRTERLPPTVALAPPEIAPEEHVTVEHLSPAERVRAEIAEIEQLLVDNEDDIHECVDKIGACSRELAEQALKGGDAARSAQEDYNRHHPDLVLFRDGLIELREQLHSRLRTLEAELGQLSSRR